MRREEARYLSYLLRMWLVGGGGQPQWRASLEETSTGERRGFVSLEDLFTYLVGQTGSDGKDQKQERSSK